MKDLTKEQFRLLLRNSSLDELSYMLGRFGGPYNSLIRERTYGYAISKIFTRAVNEELASRALDELLLSDDE